MPTNQPKKRSNIQSGHADNPETLDSDESKNSNSTSRQSCDDLLAAFGEIIARLESRPDYTLNKKDVQLATIQAHRSALTVANNEIFRLFSYIV